jgi:hypothetical protein
MASIRFECWCCVGETNKSCCAALSFGAPALGSHIGRVCSVPVLSNRCVHAHTLCVELQPLLHKVLSCTAWLLPQSVATCRQSWPVRLRMHVFRLGQGASLLQPEAERSEHIVHACALAITAGCVRLKASLNALNLVVCLTAQLSAGRPG